MEFGGSANDLLFSTKERDFSTGLDYFGWRYYDAVLGKFTTRDPSGYPDGPNNYLYCKNNPINSIDPLGLAQRDLTDEEREKVEGAIQTVMQSDKVRDDNSNVKDELKLLERIAANIMKMDEYGYTGDDASSDVGPDKKVTIKVETEKNIKGTKKPRSPAHYDQRTNTIVINISMLDDKTLKSELIEVLFHEGTHSVQEKSPSSLDRELEANTVGNLTQFLIDKKKRPRSAEEIEDNLLRDY